MQHPRVKFGKVSSLLAKNISPIMQEVFKKDLGFYSENVIAIFDQNYSKMDPEITGKEYGYLRDMEKVWESEIC